RPDLFDVGVSSIVQIWDEDQRGEIDRSNILRDACSQMAFMDYKYAIDIDGNSCSWPGLFTKLLMGNTVLKVDSVLGFRQWYYHKLIPWRNFVPVSTAVSAVELLEIADWL